MKKRYWLWLGIIFGGFAFLASTPDILVLLGFGGNVYDGSVIASIGSLIIWPVQLPMYYLVIIISGRFFVENFYLSIMMIALIPGIFYFIIGAIVGWLYGKIKNRNKIS